LFSREVSAGLPASGSILRFAIVIKTSYDHNPLTTIAFSVIIMRAQLRARCHLAPRRLSTDFIPDKDPGLRLGLVRTKMEYSPIESIVSSVDDQFF
jgi:hypothetical protein